EEPVGSARAPDGTALADPEPHIHVLRVPEDGAEAADALVGLALDDGSRVLEELLGGLDAEEVFEDAAELRPARADHRHPASGLVDHHEGAGDHDQIRADRDRAATLIVEAG